MKALVNIPLSEFSGYGRDGLGLVRAMLKRGFDVRIVPSAVQAPIPEDIAMCLTKPVEGEFDIAIQHVDPDLMKSSSSLKAQAKYYLGWTMWEYSDMTNTEKYDSLRERLQHFDALLGYDQNTVNAFEKVFDGPIFKLQGGFDPEGWEYMEDRNWDEENFYFCMLGVLSERKAPFVAIEAFAKAKNLDSEFDKKARLSLKTQQRGLHPAMEDVYHGLRIYYAVWPTSTVKEFYKAHHVLLAPSRGEGKNLPALEFQSTGGSVIATDWGGHTEWLDTDLAYPLKYSLKAFDSKFPEVYQADASVDAMTSLMLHTFHNREEVKAKGRKASVEIPKRHSWDTRLAQLLELCETLPVKESQ